MSAENETIAEAMSHNGENLPTVRQARTPEVLACITHENSNVANWMNPDLFDQMQRSAAVWAHSQLVPKCYQGKVADCIIGFDMAHRLGLAPIQFYQHSYVVNGRVGLEAQLMIGLMNTRGPFSDPIDWEFSGEPYTDDWACTAFATHKKTGRVCRSKVTWKMVKAEGWLNKDGSKWKSMPEQMFQYRSASFLGRLYCPEVAMGLSSIDELEDMGERVVTVAPVSVPALADPATFTGTTDAAPVASPVAPGVPAGTAPKRRGRKFAETIPETPVDPAPDPVEPETEAAPVQAPDEVDTLPLDENGPDAPTVRVELHKKAGDKLAAWLTDAGFQVTSADGTVWQAPRGEAARELAQKIYDNGMAVEII